MIEAIMETQKLFTRVDNLIKSHIEGLSISRLSEILKATESDHVVASTVIRRGIDSGRYKLKANWNIEINN